MTIKSLGNSIATFRDRFGNTGSRAYRNFAPFSATGGNVNALAPGNGYRYHTFTSPGTFTASGVPGIVEILVVAGGGGGGSGYYGGGGGAGGLIYIPTFSISAGSYPVTIGGGGLGVPGSFESGPAGNSGTDTTFSTLLTAKGGGGGGGRSAVALPGGSSGGVGLPGSSPAASQPLQPGNSGTYGFGNTGGGFYGGGGGGAGKNGAPGGGPAPTTSVAGGDGLQYPQFTGPLIGVPALAPLSGYFAGGGGGGAYSTPGAAGLGGGGTGSGSPDSGQTPGTTNSGGGGGGTWSTGTSGAGGPGIVIIRYLA